MLLGRRGALFTIAAGLASCHSPPPSDRAPAESNGRPVVVVIAIDGVRWQDIYQGPTPEGARVASNRRELIPHLMEIERSGVSWGAPQGADFFASGPNFVSLPGYMEMLAGTSKTACTENDCPRMTRPTLLDDFQSRAPSDCTRAGAFSSWPTLAVAASMNESGVVSAGRFGGFRHDLLRALPGCRSALEAGHREDGGHAGFRSDAITARLARAFLHEAEPEFLFVSLGESDEHAHRGDYSKYLQAIQFADSFVGRIMSDLRGARADGRQTLLLVTTDHGRARTFNDHGRQFPESSRSFLFAEGSRVRKLGVHRGTTAYLKDIAPTIRLLSGLPVRPGSGNGRVLHEILV